MGSLSNFYITAVGSNSVAFTYTVNVSTGTTFQEYGHTVSFSTGDATSSSSPCAYIRVEGTSIGETMKTLTATLTYYR
jgi:hypothetical protein